MFSMKNDRYLFLAMGQWMEKGENDKVKFILEHTAPKDLANENNSTLLHVASMKGNLNIIEYLTNFGCEINAKDSSNQTPLLLAIDNEHWDAAKFLLRHNADIFAMNYSTFQTPISRLMEVRKPNAEVVQLFFERLKNMSANKKEFLEVLKRYGCKLDKVIHLHDPEITTLFLDAVDTFVANEEHDSVEIAMRSKDEENMKVLLHHGKVKKRRRHFAMLLRLVIPKGNNDPSVTDEIVDLLRVYTRQLVQWKLLNEEMLSYICPFFIEAPAVYIRAVLCESLLSYIQNVFNYDIRVLIFGNCHPCVLKMVQNGEADMNSLGKDGKTTLHEATNHRAIQTMTYLLDSGMNPNVKDSNGQTPIFYAFPYHYIEETCSEDRFKLLLMYGADLQVHDNSGETCLCIFHSIDELQIFSHNDEVKKLLKMIAAHMAILYSMGKTIATAFISYIFVERRLERYFAECCQQIEEMKNLKFHDSLTFYETLTDSLKNLTRRVNPLDHETIATIFNSNALQDYEPFYVSSAKERLEKAMTIKNLRARATDAICDSIEMLRSYDLVIDKICSFLSFYDLSLFE